MNRLSLIITVAFLGLVTYEEGIDGAWREVELGLLALLWAARIYLNIWWIASRSLRRAYTVNCWRWRLILEPNPDQVSRRHPW